MTAFDKFKHIAPKYRANGKQIEQPAFISNHSQSNILAQNVTVPHNWYQSGGDSQEAMTQRKLHLRRRTADLPDPSFDIDGDGHVSATDLFLAKRFDKDQDGKLNEKELKTAKEAIKDGYKDQFMFGLDRAGAVQSALMVM